MTTNREKLSSWIKVAVVGGLGGGIAGSVAALSDPAKYSFPKDLGTGKMWPHFLSGAGMTIGALLLKSPLGVKVTRGIKESQEQLKESRAAIQQGREELMKGKPNDEPKGTGKPDTKA